ncbi:hypothetical protein [Massilia oculi]|uniref:hypothetical protein n=1 Tax=Massilia oculi TaxID=945844 RepID=UPI001AAF83A9|nr:hypothetical protein [Massilia oculi]
MDKGENWELMVAAANAAGIQLALPDHATICWSEEDDSWIAWNPLHDDGDAFRLAVKLGIGIWQHMSIREVEVEYYDDGRSLTEQFGSDPFYANRRAIVRLAAEMGRAAEEANPSMSKNQENV